jgi:hypothetical protein
MLFECACVRVSRAWQVYWELTLTYLAHSIPAGLARPMSFSSLSSALHSTESLELQEERRSPILPFQAHRDVGGTERKDTSRFGMAVRINKMDGNANGYGRGRSGSGNNVAVDGNQYEALNVPQLHRRLQQEVKTYAAVC